MSPVLWFLALRKVLLSVAPRLTGTEFFTFTCVALTYDGPFIRSLGPKQQCTGLMLEVIYKTIFIRGKIMEISARLDWARQLQCS